MAELKCHICENELDLRYCLGPKQHKYDHDVVELQLEHHCPECGFYRVVGLRDYYTLADTPARRLDDVLNEEEFE